MTEAEINSKDFEDEVIARTIKAFREASPVGQLVNPLFEFALHQAFNNAYARGLRDGSSALEEARRDGREDAIRWLRLHTHSVCSGPEFADALQVVLSL